jgi:AraC-like DNA-binding protein
VPPEHEWSAYLGDPAPVERFRVSNGGVYRGDALPASYREALSGLATADYEVSRDEAMPVVDALRRGEEGEARRVFEQLISARGDDRRPWARAAALYAVVLWELHGTVVAAPVETGDDPLSAIWNALLERLPARRATADLSKAPTPLRAAASHIRAHYQSPLQLADVAEIAGVSPAYLSQLFTKYCRMGFTDYLTGVRVERAKELLAGESRSVKEVGRLVGYSDPNYFSRVFRRLTGRSPSAYLDDD